MYLTLSARLLTPGFRVILGCSEWGCILHIAFEMRLFHHLIWCCTLCVRCLWCKCGVVFAWCWCNYVIYAMSFVMCVILCACKMGVLHRWGKVQKGCILGSLLDMFWLKHVWFTPDLVGIPEQVLKHPKSGCQKGWFRSVILCHFWWSLWVHNLVYFAHCIWDARISSCNLGDVKKCNHIYSWITLMHLVTTGVNHPFHTLF